MLKWLAFWSASGVLAIALVGWVTLSVYTRPLTYPEFTSNFESFCPTHYSLEVWKPNARQTLCHCMSNVIAEKWPDFKSFMPAMSKLYRVPRGEADYFPAAFRMAEPYCKKP